MGLFSRKPKQAEVAEWLIIGEDGDWNYDIVGESKYQPAIAKAVSQYGDIDARSSGRLVLDTGEVAVQPEPTNPYDPMALRVSIDGATVGYITREDAERFAEICRYMIRVLYGEPEQRLRLASRGQRSDRVVSPRLGSDVRRETEPPGWLLGDRRIAVTRTLARADGDAWIASGVSQTA